MCYHGAMKHRLSPLCLLAVPLCGIAPEVSAVSLPMTVETATDAVRTEMRLKQFLDDMQRTRDADFFAVSRYVLESTGDELAFVRWMGVLAGKGHPVAKYWCAVHMDDSQGEAKFRLLCEALEDYPPAIVAAAKLIDTGWKGNAPDRALAKLVLMDACKIGSSEARALYLMWGCPEEGEVDCSRPELASELKRHNFYLTEFLADRPGQSKDWLKEASDDGSPRAAFGMFLRLQESSAAEAESYLRLAAERHHPKALELLGCRIFAAAEPGGSEASRGLDLLMQAASTGENPRATAMVALAYASYVMGQGALLCSEAPDEVQRIADLFRSAHARGDALGSAGWGYCLVTGSGCKQDAPQGLALLQEAAKNFPRFAYLALYHIYVEGLGVEADAAQAAEFKRRYEESPRTLPALWNFVVDKATAPFLPAL